jgi:hypothetical protein
MRPLVVGLVGVTLVGFALYGGGLGLLLRPEPLFEGPCAQFLQRPSERWVRLTGCRLGVDELLVANADGIERFSERAEGLSRALHPDVPVWTALYAPLTTGSLEDRRAVRVLYRLSGEDLLAWVNAVERADEAKRRELLERRSMLLRVASPGLLEGRARRGAAADALQASLGTRAQPGLLVVEPGPVPPLELPVAAVAAGVLGLALIAGALARALRRAPPPSLEEAALGLDQVPVALGELDALRREDGSGRPPGPR